MAIITNSNIPLASIPSLAAAYTAPLSRPVEYTTNTVASVLDLGKVILLTSGSAISYTIPLNSGLANSFPLDTVLCPSQGGAGALSVVAAAGVSINGVNAGTVTLSALAEILMLWHRSENNWFAFNRTAA